MPVDENVVVNGEQNKTDTETSTFTNAKVYVSGNGNSIRMLNANVNNAHIQLQGDRNNVSFEAISLNNTYMQISGNNNILNIGSGCDIAELEIRIFGNNHEITLGDLIHVTGKLSFWCDDNNNKIIIGNYSTFGIVNFAIAEPNTEIVLGRDCMVANGVSIKNSDFHSIIDLDSGKKINKSGDIRIGHHVWIAENSHILKNANIGDNSIIALGTIVTKDVPNNCIVAGNPGKVIKTNIDWLRERTID